MGYLSITRSFYSRWTRHMKKVKVGNLSGMITFDNQLLCH